MLVFLNSRTASLAGFQAQERDKSIQMLCFKSLLWIQAEQSIVFLSREKGHTGRLSSATGGCKLVYPVYTVCVSSLVSEKIS